MYHNYLPSAPQAISKICREISGLLTHFKENVFMRKYAKVFSLSHYFFPSFKRNGVIKNCQLALEKGSKTISMTQS